MNIESQTSKDIQYILMFLVYVLADWITTVKIIDTPGLIELNPVIAFIFTLPLGFLIFYIIKIITMEIIIGIVRYQNSKIKYTGYITYTIIMVMSIYVVTNNIMLFL